MSRLQVGSLSIPHPELASILAEVLDRGGCFCFSAHGQSMWPFVLSGDRLTIQPLGDRPIKVADIILYRAPGQRLTAHRVIGMENGAKGTRLRVRGDRLRAPLELVEPDVVLGRVVALHRNGEKLRSVWARPLALAWIAVRGCLRAIYRVGSAVSAQSANLTGQACYNGLGQQCDDEREVAAGRGREAKGRKTPSSRGDHTRGWNP